MYFNPLNSENLLQKLSRELFISAEIWYVGAVWPRNWSPWLTRRCNAMQWRRWMTMKVCKLNTYNAINIIGSPENVWRLSDGTYASITRNCHLRSDAGRRTLRSHSNDIRKLLVPRTHNKLGDWSFSAAGPRLWNNLPPGLWQPGLSFDSFRRSLKTHFFGDWSA